jgi:pimeloyl-ACP methyl ester carboxylesterase
VHGYSGNARDFDALARTLATDARVICLDVAGRGESDWLGTQLEYNFAQFLADINALIARLGAERIDFVGTSMGGLLGMMLAAQPASPVARLVMNDVGAFVPMDGLRDIARGLRAPERFASLKEVEAHLRSVRAQWGELPGAVWRHYARHAARPADGGYRLHYDPRIARLVEPLPFAPGLFFWDAWYKVRCPVLLVRGERSRIFPRTVADTMLAVKPGAKLIELPDCGHAPSLAIPDQVAAVRAFLASPSARMGAAWRPASPSFPSSRPAY